LVLFHWLIQIKAALGSPISLGVMGATEDRAAVLRRRIATYRRWLSEGVPTDVARAYLAEIAKAEAELAQIEDSERRE
jgi:hypothetical protein